MTPAGTAGRATGRAAVARGGRDPGAYLVRGDDPSLVAHAARTVIDGLVGERDPALVVEEHGGVDDADIGAVLDACTTPPFLVDRRVVVVRDAGRLNAADAARLAEALREPLPSVLVLVGGGGTVPQALVKAVSAVGEVVDASVGSGRDRTRWIGEQLRSAPVRLDAGAARRLETHLGEDLGRLANLLEALAAAYGTGASLSEADLEPFLGEAGGVPPWELTDAIDDGDPAGALAALHRMMSAGGRPAPVVIATLHTHFSNMLRLDGASVATGEDAAALLGSRSTFVAKKALERGRQFGGERIGQAIVMLSEADLDVKGRAGLAPELVLEVLVARLARLSRGRAPARTGPRAGRRR